jgi:hypothetical protein
LLGVHRLVFIEDRPSRVRVVSRLDLGLERGANFGSANAIDGGKDDNLLRRLNERSPGDEAFGRAGELIKAGRAFEYGSSYAVLRASPNAAEVDPYVIVGRGQDGDLRPGDLAYNGVGVGETDGDLAAAQVALV